MVFSKAGPQMCTFGVLGLSCEAPPKRVHLRVSSFKNTTKIPREDLQRGKKRTNVAAGEGKKKERNFGRSRGRAVLGRAVLGRAVLGRAVLGRAVLGRAVREGRKPTLAKPDSSQS